jgi:hypothetical protein
VLGLQVLDFLFHFRAHLFGNLIAADDFRCHFASPSFFSVTAGSGCLTFSTLWPFRNGLGPNFRTRSVISFAVSANFGPMEADMLNISSRSGSMPASSSSFLVYSTRFLALRFPSRK